MGNLKTYCLTPLILMLILAGNSEVFAATSSGQHKKEVCFGSLPVDGEKGSERDGLSCRRYPPPPSQRTLSQLNDQRWGRRRRERREERRQEERRREERRREEERRQQEERRRRERREEERRRQERGQEGQKRSSIVYVGRTLQRGDRLGIKRQFERFSEFRGMRFKKLKLTFTSSSFVGGRAQLFINGRQVGNTKTYYGRSRFGSQEIGRREQSDTEHTIKWTPGEVFRTQDIRSMKVEFSTRVFVDEAKVVFVEEGRRGRVDREREEGPLKFFVNRYFQGQREISLARLLKANAKELPTPVFRVALQIENYGRRVQIKLCLRNESNHCSRTKLITGNNQRRVLMNAPLKRNGRQARLEDLKISSRGDYELKELTVHPF